MKMSYFAGVVVLCALGITVGVGGCVFSDNQSPRYLAVETSTSADNLLCKPELLYKNKKRRIELSTVWNKHDLENSESYVLAEFMQPERGEYSSRMIAVVDDEVFTLSIGEWAGSVDAEAMPALEILRDEFSRLEKRLKSNSAVPTEYAYVQHGRCVFVKYFANGKLYEYVLENPGLPRRDFVYPVMEVAYKASVLFSK